MRPLDLKIKGATRRLIDACGGLEAAAMICRLRKSRLAVCGDPNHPDCFMPADVIAALEAECGEPILSRVLSEATAPAGHRPPPLHEVTELHRHNAEVIREEGALAAEVLADLADGKVTIAECNRIIAAAENALASSRERLDRVYALRAALAGG